MLAAAGERGWRFDVQYRRDAGGYMLCFSRLRDAEVVEKLFEDLGPRFKARPGGYTRILRMLPRPGDNAEMALMQLVDRPAAAGAEQADEEAGAKKKSRAKKKTEKTEAAADEAAEAAPKRTRKKKAAAA